MATRRDFLQWTGIGAAASLASRYAFAEESADGPAKTQPASSRKYELGLASYTLHKFPLDQAMSIAQRLGLKRVCLNPIHLPIDSKPEVIEKTVAKMKEMGLDWYGSGVVSMGTSEQVDQAFEFAKAAGLRVIVCKPEVGLLPLLNEKVQKYDIKAAIHNHGPEDHVYPTPEAACEKIKDFDRRLGVCIDIGHTIRFGHDPCATAEKYADRVHDIHIKDLTEATRNGRPCEVGRGAIDIPRFLRTLDKIGYQGVVSFEYEKDMDDPLAGLAESVGYVRGVLAVI